MSYSRNWRERTALPPRVQIEAASTTYATVQLLSLEQYVDWGQAEADPYHGGLSELNREEEIRSGSRTRRASGGVVVGQGVVQVRDVVEVVELDNVASRPCTV